MKDRTTNKVSAQVVENTDAETLQGFVLDNALFGTTLYTDEHKAYTGLGYVYEHETVKHSVSEYVNGNGAYERDGEFLGRPEAGVSRCVSPHE